MSAQEHTRPAELVDYTTGEIRQNLSRRDIDTAYLGLFDAELELAELEIGLAELKAAAAEAKDAAEQADKDIARELKRQSQELATAAREIQGEIDGQTEVVKVMRQELERTGDLKVDSLGWYRKILQASLATCTARKRFYYRDYQRAGGRESAIEARIDDVGAWVRDHLERTERAEIEGRQWRPRLESTGKCAVRVLGETEEEREANALTVAMRGAGYYGSVQIVLNFTGDAAALQQVLTIANREDVYTESVTASLDDQAIVQDRLTYEQRLTDAEQAEQTIEPWPLEDLVKVQLCTRLMWREVTR